MGKGERRGEHLHVETLVAMRRVERAPRAAWACPLRRAGARVPRLDARGGSSPPDEGGNQHARYDALVLAYRGSMLEEGAAHLMREAISMPSEMNQRPS